MKAIIPVSLLLCILFAFFLNILGLMHIIPLYISSPLLFIALFLFLSFMNNRKKFKGFHK
ncbi:MULTISPECIES: hypothetical protein [Bacillaceae]|uniref:hypothetical protein n=1 Tax=Bacillaceae TaxID=186817 RepID=UPI001E449FC6|nr:MULTISPECIES: hypothetical protein [Bacillaceae]MCE4050483.1 hypothetical protein [Bacillus sp. Au-Bac7]MCM3030504.1 hypothetical protein [Niallia sp. MER 6]MDL0434572.1 hypothetical protein [Niallia sp. SS-2023]UPO88461.1 hypothetical protein L8T27_004650 [Niallia sp. Man26]